jgi:hypothetical protein
MQHGQKPRNQQHRVQGEDPEQPKVPVVQPMGKDRAETKVDKANSSKNFDVSWFGDFVDVICYNCGTPGHHKAHCKKPKSCFVCRKEDHVVKNCPIRVSGHKCASYLGSAASGLGFYCIETPEMEEVPPMDFTNCGLVYVESGDISMEELQLELATCFNPNWPWQIRQLEEWSYLVRFPPNKKVEDMADFNSFNLGKEGVSVSVKPWMGELEEVWIKVKGIPPKWCVWQVFDQLASSYGLLEDVGWQGIFSSFYEMVRMQIRCRDSSKIPKERLFCVDKKLYKITVTVEKAVDQAGGGSGKSNDDGDDRRDDNQGKDEFEDADDLDDLPNGQMNVDGKKKQTPNGRQGQNSRYKSYWTGLCAG